MQQLATAPTRAASHIVRSSKARHRWAASGVALSALLLAVPAWAQETPADIEDGGDVVVNGIRVNDSSRSATGLNLTLRETPQSVTVLNRDRIEQFALTSFSELIDQAVGINVDRGETDRTTYNARGFDVTNFQVDGIGLPLVTGIQYGDVDTFLFEQIEIVRGANGLVTGIGNPSATINYIRKRPLKEFAARGAAYAGSFDRLRAELDVSAPVTESGSVRARIIGAHERRGNHLDFYKLRRNVLGALIAADITPDLTATVGYMYQRNRTQGSSWGSTVHFYSDGTRIDFPRSTNFVPEWTDWSVTDQQLFGELAWDIGGGWTAKGLLTHSRFEESPTIVLPIPGTYADRTTGLGVLGFTGTFTSDYKRYYGDLFAAGPLNLFGREHQLSFGYSYSHSDGRQSQGLADIPDSVLAFPDVRDLRRGSIPEPNYFPVEERLRTDEGLHRLYFSTQINIADPLKVIAGASYADLSTTGIAYDTDAGRSNSNLSPYIGVLLDVLPQVTLYGSYTDIFNPQSELAADRVRLDPVTGNNIEAGVKSEWLDRRLYATAVLFWTKQKNLAQFAGVETQPDGSQFFFSRGVDTTARGWEVELAGKVTPNFDLSGGFTKLRLRDEDGNAARTFVPRESLKIAATYRIPEANNLRLGAQFRYQSDTSANVDGLLDAAGEQVVFRQKGYGVVDLAANIDLVENVGLSVNVRNVANQKYLYSLVYGFAGNALYAPGRNVVLSLGVRF